MNLCLIMIIAYCRNSCRNLLTMFLQIGHSAFSTFLCLQDVGDHGSQRFVRITSTSQEIYFRVVSSCRLHLLYFFYFFNCHIPSECKPSWLSPDSFLRIGTYSQETVSYRLHGLKKFFFLLIDLLTVKAIGLSVSSYLIHSCYKKSQIYAFPKGINAKKEFNRLVWNSNSAR